MRYSMLPTKNIFLGQSLFGIAAIIYNTIKKDNYLVDEAYDIIKDEYINNNILKYNIDFNQYILGLCFLYSIKKIDIKENGVIHCENN